jgi:hypothetical protein
MEFFKAHVTGTPSVDSPSWSTPRAVVFAHAVNLLVAIAALGTGVGIAGCGTAATASRSARSARSATTTACAEVDVDVVGVGIDVHISHDVAVIATLLPIACDGLLRWHLQPRRPVHVTIHDTVDSFVAATGQSTDTLRAWTTWDHVHLLTLSSWQDQRRSAVMRRLTHEMCHLGLLHRLGDERRAREARIPRAVGEGVCSVVADQASERMGIDEVTASLADGRSMDFVDDSPFAYAVAHHVMAAIARCRGDETLLQLFDDVAAGATVADALGRAPLAFLAGCQDAESQQPP